MNRFEKLYEYLFPRYRIVKNEYIHKYPMGLVIYYLIEERVLLFFYSAFARTNRIETAEELVKRQYLKEGLEKAGFRGQCFKEESQKPMDKWKVIR